MPLFNTVCGQHEENTYKELTITSSLYNIINRSYTTIRYMHGTNVISTPEYVYGFSVSEIPESVKQVIIIQKEDTKSSDYARPTILYIDVENKKVKTIEKYDTANYYVDVTDDVAFFRVNTTEYTGFPTVCGNTLEFSPDKEYFGKYVFCFVGNINVYYPRVFVKC